MSRERVIPVPSKSTSQILSAAERFLGEYDPIRLHSPGILNFPKLIDTELPSRGIDVYGVPDSEILGSEGLTAISTHCPSRIEILLRAEYYDALFCDSRSTVRARSTLVHETGHAKLHGAFLKKVRQIAPEVERTGLVLHRSRGDIPTYKDPEWQAWVYAGALLMPRNALRRLCNLTEVQIASEFGTSVEMVKNHIKRLHRDGFRLQGGILMVDKTKTEY